MQLLDPNKVEWIVLHCSATEWGSVQVIDSWHRDRGFSQIGYHWVVHNCYPSNESWKKQKPDPIYDGLILKGRSESYRGAHVLNSNWNTVGIVLVGDRAFSSRQLEAAAVLCRSISSRFPNIKGVKGHYEFDSAKDQGKTCPNIDMKWFNQFILHSNLN